MTIPISMPFTFQFHRHHLQSSAHQPLCYLPLLSLLFVKKAQHMEASILKFKLLLLTWLHLRSRPSAIQLLKCFSYKEIKKATDGFRRIIDNSSNGATYKAKCLNGEAVIIKEIRVYDDLDDDAFYGKVQLLRQLHHRNISALRGYSTGHRRFLIYEDYEKGSLKDHLSDPLKTPLNWRTRLQIAAGIAAALEYLHFFCDPPVYHVSITSSTIMLDENLIAKLSDVSPLSSAANQNALSSSSREGSSCQSCNESVYQLGLLILELITGQSSDHGGVDLVQWAQASRFSRSINKMIDPDLGNSYNPRELNCLLSIARLCVQSVDKPLGYPSQVLRYLKTRVIPTKF